MTASVIEEVMHTRSPKVSVAHTITSRAGASARSSAAFVASLAIRAGSLTSSGMAEPGHRATWRAISHEGSFTTGIQSLPS